MSCKYPIVTDYRSSPFEWLGALVMAHSSYSSSDSSNSSSSSFSSSSGSSSSFTHKRSSFVKRSPAWYPPAQQQIRQDPNGASAAALYSALIGMALVNDSNTSTSLRSQAEKVVSYQAKQQEINNILRAGKSTTNPMQPITIPISTIYPTGSSSQMYSAGMPQPVIMPQPVTMPQPLTIPQSGMISQAMNVAPMRIAHSMTLGQQGNTQLVYQTQSAPRITMRSTTPAQGMVTQHVATPSTSINTVLLPMASGIQSSVAEQSLQQLASIALNEAGKNFVNAARIDEVGSQARYAGYLLGTVAAKPQIS